MNTATRLGLSDDSKSLIRSVFEEMMANCEGIDGLMVSTVDGHSLISSYRRPMDASRLAAMTSSLLAISESLSREASQDVCRHIIVQNTEGVLVTQRLGRTLVLTSMADKTTNLGMLHSVTRAGVEKIIRMRKT